MELEKITTQSAPARRRYDDACGTAHALDLVGERWALLVMRELMLGPKRFSDLRADLAGISANVLTQRLEGLEASGLVVKRRLPPPASVQVYELTEWGYEAEPIIQTMGRWATRSPLHDPGLPLSATSLMLSFRTMFDADRAGDLKAAIGFRVGAETYLVRIEDGRLTAARGDPAEAQVVFSGTAPAVAGVVYGGVPIAAMEAEGALTVEGDRQLAERFTTLFPLPPKVDQAPPNGSASR
jgi:DNA-binding HxlR family transcriptional regulator